MSNYNLEVLLERADKGSLGIRSRQTGITLKEFFLNQRVRAKNILLSQKKKLNEALELAGKKAINGKNAKSSEVILVVNTAGKKMKRVLCGTGMTISKVYRNLKKISGEVYSVIKAKCRNIIRLCSEGIRLSSSIIKGKTDTPNVLKGKSMRSEVREYNSLLSESLANMREVFKAYYRAFR